MCFLWTESGEVQDGCLGIDGRFRMSLFRVHGSARAMRGLVLSVSIVLAASLSSAALTRDKERSMRPPVYYRTARVDGLSIFYREAGSKDAPTILLLHGVPSSSRMFEPLFSRMAAHYHLIAPDYPGFGHSDWPKPTEFAYTFDHIATVIDHFTQAVGLTRYALYMQDYGGPVGFR